MVEPVLESLIASFEVELIALITSLLWYLPRVVLAAILLWVGWRASKMAVRRSGPIVARTMKRPSLIRQTLKAIQYIVMFLFVMAILDLLEVLPYFTPLLAGIGIGAIIIGIALAPIVSGYLAGVFILSDRPYEIGDRIEILGTDPPIKGYIEDVAMRFTKIRTIENNTITVPNANMLEKDLINYTTHDKRTRMELPIGISYDSDLDKAIEIIEGVAKETDEVILDGHIDIGGVEYSLAPRVHMAGYGSSGIDLILRAWVKDPFHIAAKRSYIYKRVFEEFNKNGIEIPYPHSDIVIRDYVFDKMGKVLSGRKEK
ncbi:MAG: mechanosensitive ion channel family protein [Candidatus Hydrothermarchaeales archaeon]